MTVIAVGLGPKLNPRVLNEIADKVVYWKKEMSEKVVLKRIMANFNFQPCGKTKGFLRFFI